MIPDELDKLIEDSGSGDELVRLVTKIRGDRALHNRLKEEIVLLSGAAEGESYLIIDRRLLDDFYNGKVPMPHRLQILAALCIDEVLWTQFKQIDEMYRAAAEFKEEEREGKLPDELAEPSTAYEPRNGIVPLAALGATLYRWRIEERYPGFDYDIKPQAERRVLGDRSEMGLVDEAVISKGDVRCAITFSPRERKLELQIANCPIGREAFEQAEIVLRESDEVIRPARRSYSSAFCLVVFESVDPLGDYLLEIDHRLINE
ncbi:MAG TPA: hypothetical protein VMX35_09895 [Acidobacteriota bacterium]|nr:hypothetical protein [Acidobacteriota bacterium]